MRRSREAAHFLRAEYRMASTKAKVTGGIAASVVAAAMAIVPVIHYFEPAPLNAAGLSVAYRDMIGKGHPWTICSGVTGPNIHEGMTATPAECEKLEQPKRIEAAQAVHQCVPEIVHIPDMRDSLTDAAFNLGRAVVCGSTLQKKIKRGDYFFACMQLTDATGSDGWPDGWTRASGERQKGLVLRRIYDRDWCLGHKHASFP